MATYTITIKSLKKYGFDFGLKDYPIFDETYRDKLNNKILNYYYNNEIGFETAELFKFELNNKMEIIMPYYNNLFEAQKKALENLYINYNLEENYKGKNEANNTNLSTGNNLNKSKNVEQQNPQGKIKNENIDNFTYASNINLDSSSTEISSNSINDMLSSNNYNRITKGLTGSSFFNEFNNIRLNLLNIDELIIQDLRELFMTIF